MPKLTQRLELRISDNQLTALRKLSHDSGWTSAWIVRHAVQKYLMEKGYLKNETKKGNLR